ncbi:hypothetical protein KEJ50_02730 [Candidatus Bathyarchaeota archaeon]|nr:hypothetical protein [Candidatus Bathyarchaeota archaeon]
MRRFRDRDYIKTFDELYFTVLGNTHPKDKVIAYLKYAPSKKGIWGKYPHLYDRPIKEYTIHNIKKMMNFLKKNYPHYIHKIFNIDFSAVPCESIMTHYKPEEKLQQLIKLNVKDELQKKVVELALTLSKESKVEIKDFGVTGSILIDLHKLNFSDIDLTVYGKENSLAVKKALKNIYSKEGEIQKFSIKDFEEWYKIKGRLYPLTLKEALTLFEKAWNKGKFKETPFSIHPIKIESEIKEDYYKRQYFPISLVAGKAKIIDASESIFMPGKYKVECKLKREVKVNEIVTFEGFYAGVAEEGEEILFKGKLEKVEDKNKNESYFRIVVGSLEAKGEDYIKIVKD